MNTCYVVYEADMKCYHKVRCKNEGINNGMYQRVIHNIAGGPRYSSILNRRVPLQTMADCMNAHHTNPR